MVTKLNGPRSCKESLLLTSTSSKLNIPQLYGCKPQLKGGFAASCFFYIIQSFVRGIILTLK